jgi:hypothetical protein
MKFALKTNNGFVSLQPDGRIEFRQEVGPYETFEQVELDAPSQPAPSPDDDPFFGCSAEFGALEFVKCLHAKIQPAGSVQKAFDLTRRVAWMFRGAGAGLLIKDAGDNIVQWHGKTFSASRICYPDGHIVKVLTDVPTTNGPSWQEGDRVDPSFYVPAMDPQS